LLLFEIGPPIGQSACWSVTVELDLQDLIRIDPRYPIEAYDFVYDAVSFTQELLGRDPCEADDPDTDYHISGEELTRGACELAVQEFGLMASVVFRMWNVRRTDDIGEIVFNLIKAQKLSQSENDEIQDFQNLFDLEKVLNEEFVLSAGRTTEKGDR
jgi:uncharacterized repeat protein (TIGR04138 family)